jgi:hypothetical protein
MQSSFAAQRLVLVLHPPTFTCHLTELLLALPLTINKAVLTIISGTQSCDLSLSLSLSNTQSLSQAIQ